MVSHQTDIKEVDERQENKYLDRSSRDRMHERIAYRVRQFVFTSLAILAGLAWSDSLKLAYNRTLGKVSAFDMSDSLVLSVSYALVITSIGVLLTIFIAWLSATISRSMHAKEKTE